MSLSDVVPGSRSQPPQNPRRSSNRARERRKRRRRRRSWLVLLVSVVVVGAAVGAAWVGLRPMISSWNEPHDWTGAGIGRVTVRVQPGDTGVLIGRELVARGVVKTSKAFVGVTQRDPRSAGIQPGTYTLRSRMSAAAALTALLDPASRMTRGIQVTEGQRAEQVYAAMVKQLGFTRSQVLAAARDDDGIGLPAAAKGSPEGFLFPATYEFGPDDTPTDVLAAMVRLSLQELDDAGVSARNRRAVIIKASLVQAEAGKVADMGKVARVLDNRLAARRKLELDSTVNYATGRFAVTTTPRERASASRYNTYRYLGLPAGPIGNPGGDAIAAAVHPARGAWFYFVTVNPDTGETRFAVTAAEHSRYAKQFQAWLRLHPG